MKAKENSHQQELEELLEQEKKTRNAMLTMLEDIQEQKELIATSHREWTDAFDAIDDAVMLHDKEYKIMRVNRAYKELSGAKEDKDIVGKPYWMAFPKMIGPMHTCDESIKSGQVATEKFTLDDGRIFQSRTFPILDDEGNYSYGIHLFEDISEERRQQQQILKLNREWTDAFNAIDDAVMLHDKEYKIMRVNRAYKELSGAEKDKDIVGKPYWMAFPKMTGPMHTCIESIKSGQVATEEFTLDDGRIFKSRTFPILDDEGNYSYGIHLFEDISEECRQQQQILDLNKTLRLIGRCNELLVRSVSEKELLSAICNEIIEGDLYNFAGIFFQQQNSILCNYYASTADNLSGIQKVDFSDEKYHGCPITVCMQENKIIQINNIANDPEWTETLKKQQDICPATPFDMEGSMLIIPMVKDKTYGAIAIYSRHPNLFNEQKENLFKELTDDTAYGIHTIRLRRDLEVSNAKNEMTLQKLQESLDGTIQSVALMVEARDPYTAGHQNRVSDIAVAIARKMNLPEDQIEGIRLAGIVHDIGKIQIPAEILNKATKLSNLEYEMIKTHSKTGYDILKNIKFPWLIAQMIYQHHEHLDGSGYPNGLKGDQILLEAKILTVSDVMEAMASHRPYRPSLGIDMALAEIEKYKGVYYDPDVVDACITIFRKDGFSLD